MNPHQEQSCSLCRNTGWLLDRKHNRLEIYPCLIPDCPFSGSPIVIFSVETLKLDQVAKHPKEGYVMSIGRKP